MTTHFLKASCTGCSWRKKKPFIHILHYPLFCCFHACSLLSLLHAKLGNIQPRLTKPHLILIVGNPCIVVIPGTLNNTLESLLPTLTFQHIDSRSPPRGPPLYLLSWCSPFHRASRFFQVGVQCVNGIQALQCLLGLSSLAKEIDTRETEVINRVETPHEYAYNIKLLSN